MSQDQPARMLAVILGASNFPDAPKLSEGRAFYLSAADIKQYLSHESGLAIPRHNILSLFDDSRSPTDQLMEIAKFLSRRTLELKNEGSRAQDLLIYYVGHGLFTRGDQAYCLAVRSTNEINEGASSIRSNDLASVIKEHGAFLRRYLILDCCFAASIYKEFQSGPLNAVRAQIQHELPERGTALLCSSSPREASIAPEGLDHTMFSNALIKSLRQGHPGCGQRLSFSELGALVEENLRSEYPQDWVRPEVHSPDQREGDISHIPLFPNPAYEAQADIAEERKGNPAKAEQERLDRERAESEARRNAEAEREQLARERLAEEKAAAERSARQKAEQEKQEARAKAEAERDLREREKTAQERLAEEKAAELAARTKVEPEQFEREKADAERLAKAKTEPQSSAIIESPAGNGVFQSFGQSTGDRSRYRKMLPYILLLLGGLPILSSEMMQRYVRSLYHLLRQRPSEIGSSAQTPSQLPAAVASNPPESNAAANSGKPAEESPPPSKLASVPSKQVSTTGMTEIEKLLAKVEQNPRDPDAHAGYGSALVKAGNLDAAIEQYRAALKLPPKNIGRAYLYRDLGEALEKKGDLDGALEALRKCRLSWPVKNEPYCSSYEYAALGRVIGKKEGTQAAVEFWRSSMAVVRDPDYCLVQIEKIAPKTK